MKTRPTKSRLAIAVIGSLMSTAAAIADEEPRGASACNGCHAASQSIATAIPRLHGRPAQATIAALQGFKAGQLPATVMDRISKGFTDEEIDAIGRWFAKQK